MSTTIGPLISSKVYSSLDTYDYTVLSAGLHNVAVKVTIPAGSALSVVIKKNSTTLATSVAPVPGQLVVDLQVNTAFAVNDVIHIQLTSTAAADASLNVLKAIIDIHQGPTQ